MSEKKIFYCKDFKESRIRYAGYVRNHTKNVQECYMLAEDAFREIFPEVYANDTTVKVLNTMIQNHDKSKFNDNELYGYTTKFFPVEGTDPDSEKSKKEFKIAWLRHIHNNPHHPAYWVLPDDGTFMILDMPDIYIIEMLSDWMAMSKYHGTTTLSYWNSKSAKELPMSTRTISKVDKFMQWMKDHNVHELW